MSELATINTIWFHCKGCGKSITPHQVKVKVDGTRIKGHENDHEALMWEWMCSKCKSKTPRWNPKIGQWNNDDSSLRFNDGGMGDTMEELLDHIH